MNFNKIKSICEEKGLTIPLLADKVGLSEAGLYQSFRNQSMKVDVLEKIAQVLETPIWIFFDLDPGAQIETLKKEISGNKETIESLKTTVTGMRKGLVDLKRMLDLAYEMIDTKNRLLANYEKMEFLSLENSKLNKAGPTLMVAMKIIKDVVSGKIKIGSPEANKIFDFKQEDYPLHKKPKKTGK